MFVIRERFNDVWGRTSTDEHIVKHFICHLSISDKSVDEMFVIILNIISLNLFGCKEVTIVYSDFNNQALNLAKKLLAIIFNVVI